MLAGACPPLGYTESVLIVGDKLICTTGSETKGTFAGLDKKMGQVLWQSKEVTARADYGSPIAPRCPAVAVNQSDDAGDFVVPSGFVGQRKESGIGRGLVVLGPAQ